MLRTKHNHHGFSPFSLTQEDFSLYSLTDIAVLPDTKSLGYVGIWLMFISLIYLYSGCFSSSDEEEEPVLGCLCPSAPILEEGVYSILEYYCTAFVETAVLLSKGTILASIGSTAKGAV